ncbi:hypothetical protein ACA910_015922 [Epithemia clementina (nom. ined.)]
MDTATKPALCVHRPNGDIMKFTEYHNGLYYFETASASPPQFTMLQTVASNASNFSRREVEGARAARTLYRHLGRPSRRVFELILANNLLRNCPITLDDARRADKIFGSDIGMLKGVKGPSSSVPSTMPTTLPAHIMESHHRVTLAMDIFYVNGIAFFHTISRKLQFRTIAPIASRNKATLLLETMAIIKLYQARGFIVDNIHADREFECIKNELLPVNLNTTAADDHVGEVERSVRTIKERVRATIQGLLYRRLTVLMIRELVIGAVKALNMFPVESGISDTMSPRELVVGTPKPDFNNLKLEFGAYAQVFEDNNPTNTMASRMTGAIALNHTDNIQGDYFFMSLATGARISRHQWTELPISQEAIARVEQLAEVQGQKLIQKGLVFEWRPEQPVDDGMEEDEDEKNEDPTLDEDEGAGIAVAEQAHVGLDDGENAADEQVGPVYDQGEAFGPADVANIENIAEVDDEIDEAHEVSANESGEGGSASGELDVLKMDQMEEEQGAGSDGVADVAGVITDEVAAAPPANTGRYSLRQSRNRTYEHLYPDHEINLCTMGCKKLSTNLREAHCCFVGYVMTQMTATAGIKKHGEAAVEALFKELAQLDNEGVFVALDASKLNRQQRRQALRAINLIKEKRNGALKGRTCADGSIQRGLYDKAETASPTLSNDAFMLSLLIDAHERRDIAVADVVGAYLNARMTDFVVMKLTGDAVDIMCQVNTSYAAFVTIEKGQKVLYVQLARALYGCVKSALLWYELFASVLTERGFKLNPYDPCVANCSINGKQCTVVWYVDDDKISHVDPAVVTSIIKAIEEKFGKMTVSCGKNHSFLGMNIMLNDDRTATIHMPSYLDEAMAEFGEELGAPVGTPATRELFEENTNALPLCAEKQTKFHTIVAKLLYVAHQGCPDLQPTIPYLCTRVANSNTQDWEKLRRLLRYIKGTQDLTLTLGAENFLSLKSWVDASYAVHSDLKSHIGGAMSLGRGAFCCKSAKQRLNTKSSTEAELVGISDYLPKIIWARMFLEAQGLTLSDNVLAQDNQSAIQLACNGRASAGQKSRHIDIRFFLSRTVWCPKSYESSIVRPSQW